MANIDITTVRDDIRITREELQAIANDAYAFGVGIASDDWERGFAAGLEALADHLTGRRKYSNANVLAEALPALASLPHC